MTGDNHGFARHTQQHAEWPPRSQYCKQLRHQERRHVADDDGDPRMCQHSTTETMATDACHSTTARAAASGSSLNPAIAVCSAHTARCRARRSSRTGSAVEDASSLIGSQCCHSTPSICPTRIASRSDRLLRGAEMWHLVSPFTKRAQMLRQAACPVHPARCSRAPRAAFGSPSPTRRSPGSRSV